MTAIDSFCKWQPWYLCIRQSIIATWLKDMSLPTNLLSRDEPQVRPNHYYLEHLGGPQEVRSSPRHRFLFLCVRYFCMVIFNELWVNCLNQTFTLRGALFLIKRPLTISFIPQVNQKPCWEIFFLNIEFNMFFLHRSCSTLGQVLDRINPLPHIMLTYHQRCSLTLIREQFHKNCSHDVLNM